MANDSFSRAETEAKEKLRAAVRKLNTCYREQNDLTKQIADLRSVIAAFARMRNTEFVEEDEFGMTDAIRLVMATNGLGMTPEEVSKGLYEIGFGTDDYQNPMAAIGTALKRLVEQKQVSVVRNIPSSDGKTRYQWCGGPVELKTLTSPAHDSGMRGDEQPKSLSSTGYSPTPRIHRKI